ncbi:unnamed protein product [Gongylonema pulchrum]|uniref:Cytochrome P450 n=1 Tax=Gongylonema pulchrum TaxID=637853 RepID=A0A183EFG6_9BILA|nr:unnamed protein product [Gongylonema pulchrum]
MRAIVQSTPLSFRMDASQEDAHLYKKYTIGVFDRSQIIKQYNDHSADVSPNLPHNGCAGFESSFFMPTNESYKLLILIRAVSFFLNPMYRFWLEPAVLRDVMHEHVQRLGKSLFALRCDLISIYLSRLPGQITFISNRVRMDPVLLDGKRSDIVSGLFRKDLGMLGYY